MRILVLLLLSFLSLHAHAQVPVGVMAASTYYRGEETPPSPDLDNDDNTNGSDQQLFWGIGNSIVKGVAENGDVGHEIIALNTRFEFNWTSIVELTNDVDSCNTGSWWPALSTELYYRTSKKPVIVNSGSPGAEWYANGDNNHWGSTGTLRAKALSKLNLAKTAAGVTKVRAIILDGPINDARRSSGFNAATLKTAGQDLIDWIQSVCPGVDIWVINSGRREAGNDDAQTLATHQVVVELIEENDGLYLAGDMLNLADDPNEFYGADRLHLQMYGNEWVGVSAVKNMWDQNRITHNPITRTYSATALTAFTNANITDDDDKDILSDLIDYGVRKSLYTPLDELVLSDFSLEDFKNSSRALTLMSGAMYSGGIIYTDGTITGAVQTGFTPSTATSYTQNAASAAIFLHDVTSTTGTLFGATGSTATQQSILYKTATGMEHRTNSGTLTSSGLDAFRQQWLGLQRANSTTQTIRLNSQTGNGSVTSTGRPNAELYIGAENNNGTLQNPCDMSFRAFVAGSASAVSGMRRHIQLAIIRKMIWNPAALAYVEFPDPPTLTDTHTLVQATTGTGIQSGDLGGKQNFYVSGNYSFMQFNVVNTDDYALRSLDVTSPATWSKIGSPSPQDYAIDEVNAAHGYSFYNLWFRDADNLIKKRPFDTTGVLSPIVFRNCIFTNAGFGGILINQNIVGRGYGKMNVEFCSFTGGGAERIYGGSTGSPNTKYRDTTTVTHLYSDSSRREVVQLNNHKYVRVSNVTGRHVGVVQEVPPQGIGQENGFQCQGCGGGYIKNSIFESTAPGMIASTSLDLINNRITWSKTDRAMYLQDLNGNGYAYKNVDDDTVVIDGNDFICPGFTLPYVIYIQEDDFVVVIKNNRFPPSATSVYTCSGPCPTIIMSGNTFDSDLVPAVTFGDHPNPDYAPYWKVVTSSYDYEKHRGALTPEP